MTDARMPSEPRGDSGDGPLDDLVALEAPPLDETTRDRIESGLRVQHAARRGPAPRVAGRPRWALVAPVVVVALMATTLLLVLRDETAVAALELRDAEDVTVRLPDGEVVDDPADGFRLADGAVVEVGAAGSVVIGDVALQAGTVVTVRDGRLVTDVIATTTSVPVDPPPRDTRPPETLPPETLPPESVPPDTRPPDTVPPDTRPPESRPPETPPSDTLPSDTLPAETLPPGTVPSDARPPGDEPSPTAPGPEVEVGLRVALGDGVVRVAWNVAGVEAGWRVVVVRTTDGTVPDSLTSGSVVGEGLRGERIDRRDELPDDLVALRYRVLVLDEADGVVAASATQTVRLDP